MPAATAGRDARASGAGGASQAAPSSAERERQTLRDQLAAWKERKALEKQQQQARKRPGAPRQPTRSTVVGARSVEEKPRSSQQRREPVRSPVAVRERQPKPPPQPRTTPPRPVTAANVPSTPTRRGNTTRMNGGVQPNAERRQRPDEGARRVQPQSREATQQLEEAVNNEYVDDVVKEEEPTRGDMMPEDTLTLEVPGSGGGQTPSDEGEHQSMQQTEAACSVHHEQFDYSQSDDSALLYPSVSDQVEEVFRGDLGASPLNPVREEQQPSQMESAQHQHFESHTEMHVQSAFANLVDEVPAIESVSLTAQSEQIYGSNLAETRGQNEAMESPERRPSTCPPKFPSPVKKQVRFLETVAVKHLPVVEMPHPVQREDTICIGEAIEERSSGSLVDNDETLIDAEVFGLERLMSEADELIHFHAEETVIMDHIVHEHTTRNGQIHVDEVVSEEHVEQSSLEHVIEHVEELDVLQRAAKNAIQETRGTPVLAQRKRVPTPVRGNPMSPVSTMHHSSHQSPESHSPIANNSSHESTHLSTSGIHTSIPVATISSSHPPQTASNHQRAMPSNQPVRSVKVRKIVELSLLVICLIFVDRFFPTSPVSRALRVAVRVVYGVSVFLASRSVNWLWVVCALPIAGGVQQLLQNRNDLWSPLASALQSLHDYHSFSSAFSGHKTELENLKDSLSSSRRVLSSSLFFDISSKVADFFLFIFQSLHRLDAMDPDTLRATESRIEDLAKVQRQLQSRVEEVLRAQEEWALGQLEMMRQRRVEHSKAAEAILSGTKEAILQVALETRSLASEHIHDFTNQLTAELMSTIQPQLDEYKRLESAEFAAEADHNAVLLRVKDEEAAKNEILRVENAKRQGDAEIVVAVINDHRELEQDKVFAEVDVAEIIECAGDRIEAAGKHAFNEVKWSLSDAVDSAIEVTEVVEEVIDAKVLVAEESVKASELEMLGELAREVLEKEETLQREHDTAQAEIERTAVREIEKLEAERIAAEVLAAAAARAEDVIRIEAGEAERLLDEQLNENKKKLEDELLHGAAAAEIIELIEIERVEAQEGMLKERIEQQVLEEVMDIVKEAQSVELEVISNVLDSKRVLDELQVAAEAVLEEVAAKEHDEVSAEQSHFMTTTDKVAVEIELEIAAGVGIEPPPFVSDQDSVPNTAEVTSMPAPLTTSGRSSVDETELKHMMMMSVGFVLLAVITGLILYPRWQLLITNPKKAQRFSNRSHRRRSWQRPAEVSDSEPEEVTLIQSGPLSDDAMSESNEPEPEVVEFMHGSESSGESTPPSMYSTVTRTSTGFSSYSRSFNARSNVHTEEEEVQEAETEFQTPAPLRRALRRRSTRRQ